MSSISSINDDCDEMPLDLSVHPSNPSPDTGSVRGRKRSFSSYRSESFNPPIIFRELAFHVDEDTIELQEMLRESCRHWDRLQSCITSELASTPINHNMRRVQTNKEKYTDPEYLERRKKNNEAAKKSRDARKEREIRLVFMESFLVKEYSKYQTILDVEEKSLERLKSKMQKTV